MLYKKKIEYEDSVSSNLMQKTIITTMSMTIEILVQRVETLEKQMADLLVEKKKTEKKEKKAKKKSKDTDDDEPKKKKKTGYLLFNEAARKEATETVSKESGSDDPPPKSTDIMKKLGAMWRALSEDERQAWNTKAKELADNA